MTAVAIDGIGGHLGQEIEIRGWVYNLRSSGSIHFLLLRDGTGILQAVAVRQDLPPEVFEAVGARTQGHVEQDHVGVIGRRAIEGGASIGDGEHAVALAFEGTTEHLAQRRFVVHYEDVQWGGLAHVCGRG